MAKNKFYRPILYYLLMTIRGFFLLLPFSWGFHFAGSAGRTAFYLLSRERRKTLSHLKLAFPEKTDQELARIGVRMFEHYGQTAAEWALIDKLFDRMDTYVTITGREHLDRALAQGKGVIGIISHYGNWEFLGGFLAWSGYKGSVIARRLYYEKYDKRVVGLRSRFGMGTIYRDESPREILKVLKRNHLMGLVVDQDVATIDGVFVEFFGRPAFTPSAPVRLALRTGAPMMPMFILRTGMHHEVILEPPIELTVSGDKEKDIITNTQKWAAIQEKYIRRAPQHWVWNHKRWKTTPKTA